MIVLFPFLLHLSYLLCWSRGNDPSIAVLNLVIVIVVFLQSAFFRAFAVFTIAATRAAQAVARVLCDYRPFRLSHGRLHGRNERHGCFYAEKAEGTRLSRKNEESNGHVSFAASRTFR